MPIGKIKLRKEMGEGLWQWERSSLLQNRRDYRLGQVQQLSPDTSSAAVHTLIMKSQAATFHLGLFVVLFIFETGFL